MGADFVDLGGRYPIHEGPVHHGVVIVIGAGVAVGVVGDYIHGLIIGKEAMLSAGGDDEDLAGDQWDGEVGAAAIFIFWNDTASLAAGHDPDADGRVGMACLIDLGWEMEVIETGIPFERGVDQQ